MRGGTIVLYASSITCLLSGLLWCALVTDQKSDLSNFPVPGLPLFVLGSLDPNHSKVRILDFVVTEYDWYAITCLIQGLFVTILSMKLCYYETMFYKDICESIWIGLIDSQIGLKWFLNFCQILPNVYDFLAFVEQ